jgi:hypothetical protein
MPKKDSHHRYNIVSAGMPLAIHLKQDELNKYKNKCVPSDSKRLALRKKRSWK